VLRAEVIDPKITGHKGRIVKTTGDGVLVEFAGVVDAVRSAVAVQHENGGNVGRRGLSRRKRSAYGLA
jgi:adenylate cyclase